MKRKRHWSRRRLPYVKRSPLWLLNFCILQWLFIRFAYVTHEIKEYGHYIDVANVPSHEVEAFIAKKKCELATRERLEKPEWRVLRWIVPLSGWSDDYAYL